MKYNYLLLSILLSLNQLTYASLFEKEEANQSKSLFPKTIEEVGKRLNDNKLMQRLKDDPEVEILNVLNNGLTNKCIESIGNCKKIKFLNLAGNIGITYEGIMKLLSTINVLPITKSLKTLHLSSTNFREDQKGRLLRQALLLELEPEIYFDN